MLPKCLQFVVIFVEELFAFVRLHAILIIIDHLLRVVYLLHQGIQIFMKLIELHDGLVQQLLI